MRSLAVSVEGLGKRYRIGSRSAPYGRLTESISGWLKSPFRRERSGAEQSREWIWALNDVTFAVQQGEIVGFVGANGAGKTTLLKVLSRITEPTSGSVRLRGRVGSLLEVGVGFHAELTGRENVLMSSAVFGMKRAEIAQKFDEIVNFAGPGVERFLDTPVKHYSTGMQLRLGFAVAAHLDPDILIVDEVLAVGDAAFQKKCLGKMGEVAGEGRTVLLVSHNMSAIQALCQRALWLDRGAVIRDGEPSDVVAEYLGSTSASKLVRSWSRVPETDSGPDVQLLHAGVRPDGGVYGDPITLVTPLVLDFHYHNSWVGSRLKLIIEMYNEQSVLVIHSASFDESNGEQPLSPTGRIGHTCRIPGRLLNTGTYSITVKIVRDEHDVDVVEDGALVFDVVDDDPSRSSYHRWLGAVRPSLAWTTDLVG